MTSVNGLHLAHLVDTELEAEIFPEILINYPKEAKGK